MTQRERQGWLIVASLWVTLFIIFGGGYLTAGVFFTPLLKTIRMGPRAALYAAGVARDLGGNFGAAGWLATRQGSRRES